MHAEQNGGSTVQKATVWKVGSAGRGGLMYEYGTRFHNYSILEQLVLMEMISTGEMISMGEMISTGGDDFYGGDDHHGGDDLHGTNDLHGGDGHLLYVDTWTVD